MVTFIFTFQATVGDFKAAGYGESKKAAKLNAATNLLKMLGIDLNELRREKGIKEALVRFACSIFFYKN